MVPEHESADSVDHQHRPRGSRRAVLASAATVVTAGSAGCIGVLEGSSDESSSPAQSTGWTTYRSDPQRTGRVPAEEGPGDSLSVDWETTVIDVAEHREDLEITPEDQADDATTGPVGAGSIREAIVHDDLVLATVFYRTTSNWGGVVALDAATGSVEWTVAGMHSTLAAPTVVGDRLYQLVDFATGVDAETPHVLVADAASGSVFERRPFPGQIDDAPSIDDDVIYTSTSGGIEGTLLATATDRDERRWVGTGPEPTEEYRAVTPAGETLLYSGLRDERRYLVSLEADTGDVRWTRRLDLPEAPLSSSRELPGPPTVYDDRSYLGGTFRGYRHRRTHGAALIAVDTDSGTERWRFRPDPAPYATVPSDEQETQICAVTDDCEGEVLASGVHCYPLLLEGTVVVPGFGQPSGSGGSQGAGSHIYGVDDADGSLQWSVPGAASSVVAAGDVLYARIVGDGVLALSPDGEVLDTVQFESDLASRGPAPAIGHGRLYATYRRHTESETAPDTIAALA